MAKNPFASSARELKGRRKKRRVPAGLLSKLDDSGITNLKNLLDKLVEKKEEGR